MNVNFNDLHDKMYQKTSNLISADDFQEWLDNNIDINKYISISKKYAIASVFSDRIFFNMTDLDIFNDIDNIFLQYEIEKIFIILSSYTNINIEDKNRNIQNYDLIMNSGLYDYIENNCRKDCNKLSEIIDKVSGINTLSIMQQFVMFIGKQPSVEDMEKIKDIINNEIDKDKLEILQTVQEYNNPMIKNAIKSANQGYIKKK